MRTSYVSLVTIQYINPNIHPDHRFGCLTMSPNRVLNFVAVAVAAVGVAVDVADLMHCLLD